MPKNKIDPYADFGPSAGKSSAASSSQAPTGNLSKPHLAIVILGAVIALVSGIIQLNQGVDADVEGFAKWAPLGGVALGFLMCLFAGRKVKKFQQF